MRLDYAQFLELEMFSRFGGVPDVRVKQQLARGVRLRALLVAAAIRAVAPGR